MKQKIILFYVDWENTSGNHAGMAHWAKQLSKIDGKIIAIKTPEIRYNYYNLSSSISINNFISKWIYKIKKNIIQYTTIFLLKILLNSKDKLILMEYLTDTSYRVLQEDLARKINNKHNYELLGLIHLPLGYLKSTERYKTDDKIIQTLNFIDRAIVFGSSLANNLKELKPDLKTIRLLHYADTNYYIPKFKIENSILTIICAGSIMRNYSDIIEIINNSPNIHFNFCIGRSKIDLMNFKHNNVTIYGYLSEFELKEIMQKSDASLNVFSDTIGSNVITTSLACGLPLIVSDVGSIRDYCDSSNAFFCKTLTEFINCIESLSVDKNMLIKMSNSAFERSKEFSIKNTYLSLIQKLAEIK